MRIVNVKTWMSLKNAKASWNFYCCFEVDFLPKILRIYCCMRCKIFLREGSLMRDDIQHESPRERFSLLNTFCVIFPPWVHHCCTSVALWLDVLGIERRIDKPKDVRNRYWNNRNSLFVCFTVFPLSMTKDTTRRTFLLKDIISM